MPTKTHRSNDEPKKSTLSNLQSSNLQSSNSARPNDVFEKFTFLNKQFSKRVPSHPTPAPFKFVRSNAQRTNRVEYGDTRIELLEATSADSPIAKFIEKRGGGIHHIAVEVENIEESLAKLKSEGARLIDEQPRIGAENCLIAFVHPSSTNGVLLELIQKQ